MPRRRNFSRLEIEDLLGPRTSYLGLLTFPFFYSNTARLAVWVVPLYEAEIVAEVDTRTIDVFTVKVALLLPAGTVTMAGTLAAPLPLERVTCAPPAGAGPLSVTVPVEDCTPPTTLVGFSVSEATVGGVTVSAADLLAPPYDAEMVITVDVATALVLTVNVAVVLSAGTTTLGGMLANALLLERLTCVPPAGANPLSVTLPMEGCGPPPVTLVGFNVSE